MKHPDPIDWMGFLYGEVPREQRADLDAHLAVCPDCVRRLARWRETTGLLDAAGVPERPVRARSWRRAIQWAAAAAVLVGMLGGGFLLGRRGAVSDEQLEERLAALRDQLRADVGAQRGQDLRQVAEATVQLARAENRELLAEFLRRYQVARAEDRAEILSGLRQLDERRGVETARLREGLVKLAASTGSGFEQTHHQMQWLTSYLPAGAGVSEPLSESANPHQDQDNP